MKVEMHIIGEGTHGWRRSLEVARNDNTPLAFFFFFFFFTEVFPPLWRKPVGKMTIPRKMKRTGDSLEITGLHSNMDMLSTLTRQQL